MDGQTPPGISPRLKNRRDFPRRGVLLSGMALFSPLAAAVVCLSLGTVLPSAHDDTGSRLHPRGLRCEYLTNPLGVGETLPRLSWTSASRRRGERQSAYQVLVASTPDALAREEADRWDSGRVASDESAHVVYAGRPLASRAACFWKVRLWDGDDHPSAWSESARWTVGLLEPADWVAKWIDGHDPRQPDKGPGFTLRRAVYGTDGPGKSADVTAAVRTLVEAGKGFTADNGALGGDPSPNQVKRLHLEYEQGGLTFTLDVNEGDPVRFGSPGEPPRALRKTFSVDGDIARATLYVTALGLYECRINGQTVGDGILTPDWTDYDKRVRYQAYDVGSLLRPGGNALAALVADGWYSGHIGNHGFQKYGTVPALMAQLEIVHADGRIERIVSDDTWKSHASAILSSDLLQGETYDARREIAGWDGPGFDDQDWTPAHVREEPPRSLDAQVAPPVRVLGECRAVALTEPAPGRWVFDLGQNMVGVVHLKIRAPEGKTLILRHAEMLNPDGTIYTANLRGAASTDTYLCKGGGTEEWQPRFTLHGFRYVELTGLPPGRPDLDAVTGVVIGSDTPAAGTFACLRSAFEPAHGQHRVGTTRQLRQRAHRLSATRRTARLDGRRAGVHPHGDGLGRRSRVLHELDGGRGRRADGRRRIPERRSPEPQRRGLRWLGRRGRDLSVDDLPGIRRPAHPRTAPARDDALGGMAAHE